MSKCKKKVKCSSKYDDDDHSVDHIFDDDFCNVKNILLIGVAGLCAYYFYSNCNECDEIKPNECKTKHNCYNNCNI
jgi:hypothetical protein